MVRQIRLLFLGPESCGKTALINTIIYEDYKPDRNQEIAHTIEDTYNCCIDSDKNSKLRIYEIGGKTTLSENEKHYFVNLDGIVFVSDITNQQTFEELKKTKVLVDKLREKREIPSLLLANKSDLQSGSLSQEMLQWAQSQKIPIYPSSVHDRNSILSSLSILISKILVPSKSFPFGKKDVR